MNLKEWFQRPTSTLAYGCNPPALTPGLMGAAEPEFQVPPKPQIHLGTFSTDFGVVFNRPKNVLTGG